MNSKTEKLIEAHTELYTEICRVGRLVYAMQNPGRTRHFDIDDEDDHITVDDDTINISWEEYHCSCCGPDHESLYFSSDYLFNDGWEAEFQARIDLEETVKQERAQKEKEEQEAREVERAREEYLKLRNRFEGEAE